MNATAKRVLVIVGIVAIAGMCYLWGHHAGRQETIRQVSGALRTGRASPLNWWTKSVNSTPGMQEWIVVGVFKGEDGPYWTFENGKALNQSDFERTLEKMQKYGLNELIVKAEPAVTVQQVELTLDLLKAHAVTNIALLNRVQGVLEMPWDGLDGMMKEVEPISNTNRVMIRL